MPLPALRCVVVFAAILVAVQGLLIVAAPGATAGLIFVGALIAAVAGALAALAIWAK